MTWLTLVRGGPFDTWEGGGLWFFFLSKLFFSFQRPNNIFFSLVDPNSGMKQSISLLNFVFFSCVVRTNFSIKLSAEQTCFCFFVLFCFFKP